MNRLVWQQRLTGHGDGLAVERGRRHAAGAGLVALLVLLLAQFLVAGCDANKPPYPAPAVNANLDKHAALYGRTGKTGDTVLLTRCRSCEKFGERTHGNWIHTWLVARFDVLAVEQGTWPEAELSFICRDAWPTPESGIMVSKLPWPYRANATLRFWLDTTRQPALVVGQETVAIPQPTTRTAPAVPGFENAIGE
jgi:hypothetical protein